MRRWPSLNALYALGIVPRPPHWADFCNIPLHLEFWTNRLLRHYERNVFAVPLPKTIGPTYSYTPDGASLIAVFRSDIESASRLGPQTGRTALQGTSEVLRVDQSLVEHYIDIGLQH